SGAAGPAAAVPHRLRGGSAPVLHRWLPTVTAVVHPTTGVRMTTAEATSLGAMSLGAMTEAERGGCGRSGDLGMRGGLTADEVARYTEALDRVHGAQRATGRVVEGAAMHVLGAVAHAPEMVGLTDHPATFRFVWSLLGWNVHIYHSHLDVH